MIRGILVACILVALYGCASLEEKIQNVQVGASRNQVIGLLGNPDGVERSGAYEALRYANRPIDGSSTERADYNVIFVDGYVAEYGYGYVKQRDPSVNNKLILVPLK